MKMKVEFKDHDEYDELTVDLVWISEIFLDAPNYKAARAVVKMLRKLLEAEMDEG